MYKAIGWVTALVALVGCASGPETGADVGFVSDADPTSSCELTGGTTLAAAAGAICGQQPGGDSCIWSPMAVAYGAQDAGATCGDRDCACVTEGNIHEACAPSAPVCTCGEGTLYVGETAGCADVEPLEASFATAAVGELIGAQGVWVMSRGGAIDSVAHFADLTSLLETHSWLGFGLAETCALEPGSPDHDCDAGFGETQGCFLDATADYAGAGQRMADLVTYAEQAYADDTIDAARAIDAQVVASVTVTEANLQLHFGRDDDGWKLLVIDATAYDCGG